MTAITQNAKNNHKQSSGQDDKREHTAYEVRLYEKTFEIGT